MPTPAEDIAATPYWMDDAPRVEVEARRVLPRCDVVVIGAGYTGLSAALTLARAGRSVQVFDRMRLGEGASTRNGGICSGNLRLSRAQMIGAFGQERALAMLRESVAAREDLRRFIEAEGIDCDYALTGRFYGAVGAGDYDALAREAEILSRTLGVESFAVPKSEQRRWLGTDFYDGGSVRMDIAGLHPAKLFAGLARRALEAGVVIHPETAALRLTTDGEGCLLSTARGMARARDAVVAVNGYADASDPWLRRRLVPVRSRIVATEPLPAEQMDRLMPARAMCGDTRKLSYYYRPSPDGTRILFGGRDGTYEGDAAWPTEHLRGELARLFPELASVRLTHSWFGNVAMNRDMVPRLFSREGLRYAVGYCGSGVVWARWNGAKAALQILGRPEGASAFDFRAPPAVPLYNGAPWFLPALFALFRAQDSRKTRKARRS